MYTKGIVAQQKSYGFKSLVKLGVENINFKITKGRTDFNFSSKTSVFAGLGALFEKKMIFCQIESKGKGKIKRKSPHHLHPPNSPQPPTPTSPPPTPIHPRLK